MAESSDDGTIRMNRRQEYIERIKVTERMMKHSESRYQIVAQIQDRQARGRIDQAQITIHDEGTRYSDLCVSVVTAKDKMITRSKELKAKISKVEPKFGKEFGMEFFEPKVVSIGPYHHGKSKLKFMQDLKPALANHFIEHSDIPICNFCEAIMLMIDEVRQFYERDYTNDLTDEQLVDMMFLDGCFILTFVFCITWSDDEYLGMTNYQIEQVHKDLLLMGNQIPFQVLDCLKKCSAMVTHYTISINQYICENTDHDYTNYRDPIHLLDAARQALVGRSNMIKERTHKHTRGPIVRNVKELNAVGIYFKALDNGTVNNISFKSFGIYGQLSLPKITFDKSTKSLFLNLIAYEMCNDKLVNDFGIISYICFLDSLIDNADDVKELRSAGIISNNLNSDGEVAQIINDMGSQLVPDLDSLLSVKAQMREYLMSSHKLKLASWSAEVIHKHFQSPLAIFLVVAATFAIFLTAVQTYYTVFK